jgi:SAM-dependent methyltransferase
MLSGLLKLSMLGQRQGPHITRYYMYNHLSQIMPGVPASARVLSISHSIALCESLGMPTSQIVEANYPAVNILSLPYPDDEFDFVVSDQVLEHVEGDPYVAVAETFRVLKPGGVAIHTTCFMNPVHGAPSDFWRFSPDALRLLCPSSATIVDAAGWGNPYVFIVMSLGLRYLGVPDARWHPFHWAAMSNHPRLPVTTWVVAKKA